MSKIFIGTQASNILLWTGTTKTYPNKRFSTGFTITELLISLTLLIVLAAISIPSLAGVMQKSQLKHSESQLLRSLAMARTAAMSQAKTVIVCARDHTLANNCGYRSARRYADWSYGWIVFVDIDNDGQRQDYEELISVSMRQEKVGIVYNQNGKLRFNEMGRARSAGFYICGAESRELTHVKVLHSGRYRSAISNNSSHLTRCKSSLSSVQNRESDEGQNKL